MPTGIVTFGSWKGQELRSFNDSAIQSQIDRALQHLTPGKKGAVIAYADWKTRSINGAVVARVGDKVSIVGTLSHNIGASWRDIGGAAAVRYEW